MNNEFKKIVSELYANEPQKSGRTSTKSGIPASQLSGMTGRPEAGPPLREGEVSSGLRVRMPGEVAEWWGTLSAFQRGAVVTAAHRLLTATDS